ncbi:hypothetical protein CLAFUW4_02390 [Fulvia fulva]|uniref:Uncharacterized protein n=1 Tax=Passalora fulva TaxID=5499 RepID=A0A9Q8LC25_PASFU|nr:uncharacterized protein CLAFUR5_02378 [Fulvia fulva]KAK4631191.1 hypothetical protein CLAFUR4_02385 [Fulvia fulva]KAK4632620.1 hypothetical protein CLAFUR0_02389 [Fulvia fulva]UJO14621.1 hypothetical protein CLAFUR5_02378 [Fulvia fulva]WPV10936.1 hypothetical protein CLAFUW4_02390 [Fulvia fulva]WPV25871.1 hypothetical protein CLAFUW7_02390 [Fulvia fulva]
MVHAADPDSTTFNEFIEHTKLNGHGIQELSSRKPSNASAIDKRDMWRMGKVQELRRYFGPWAIIGFASILGCAWEYALITVIFSLPNKGPAGAAYMFLACCVGLMPATLSLAEMSTIALVAVMFNTVLVRKLPVFEFIILILHIAAYIAFEVVLLSMGPQSTRQEVFEQWENANRWPSLPTAVLVGIIAPVTTLTSADSICHLAEELKEASIWLPRCMVGAAALNFSISFLMLLTVLFRAGDIEKAISSPTGQLYIEILLNTTGSVAGTAIMVSYIILSLLFCAVNMVTTSSRQLYSFARDGGLPFSKFFAKVSPRNHIPMNAVCSTLIFTVVLSLVLIGSPLAYNIIASLGAASILGSYLISISCIAYRKATGYRLPPTRFPLGRLGLPINILALCFLSLAFVLVFFPAAPDPKPQDMNWVSLIFGSVIGFALIFYVVSKRNTYKGPVEYVRPERDWDVVEMSDRKASWKS